MKCLAERILAETCIRRDKYNWLPHLRGLYDPKSLKEAYDFAVKNRIAIPYVKDPTIEKFWPNNHLVFNEEYLNPIIDQLKSLDVPIPKMDFRMYPDLRGWVL